MACEKSHAGFHPTVETFAQFKGQSVGYVNVFGEIIGRVSGQIIVRVIIVKQGITYQSAVVVVQTQCVQKSGHRHKCGFQFECVSGDAIRLGRDAVCIHLHSWQIQLVFAFSFHHISFTVSVAKEANVVSVSEIEVVYIQPVPSFA